MAETELTARVAWIREQQAAGLCPDVDLYLCSCGLWTIAVKGTPDVKCSCGKAPECQETVTAPGTDAEVGTTGAEGPAPKAGAQTGVVCGPQ
jgi:hypothetical protein